MTYPRYNHIDPMFEFGQDADFFCDGKPFIISGKTFREVMDEFWEELENGQTITIHDAELGDWKYNKLTKGWEKYRKEGVE